MRRLASLTTRILVGFAVVAATALLVAACSPGGDYPSVLDRPMPRADTPMSPAEVKQATDSLISERDHLSAGTPSKAAADPSPTVTGSTTAAKRTKKKPPPVAQGAAVDSTQTAGADTKP